MWHCVGERGLRAWLQHGQTPQQGCTELRAGNETLSGALSLLTWALLPALVGAAAVTRGTFIPMGPSCTRRWGTHGLRYQVSPLPTLSRSQRSSSGAGFLWRRLLSCFIRDESGSINTWVDGEVRAGCSVPECQRPAWWVSMAVLVDG